MITLLTIAGTALDGPARAEAGVCNLSFSWDLESYWSLTFSVVKLCNSGLPHVPGVPVSLSVDLEAGDGPEIKFVGDLQRPQCSVSDTGVVWHYSCTDLKRRADYITLTGLDGSGTASFNLSPDDPLYLYNTAGQTVGDVVAAVLQSPANATALADAGIGNYDSLSPPALPAVTLGDLAALQVVPPEPVQLSGESILNVLEQFILRWHAQYCLYVLPDGTIRVRSVFGMTPVPVALPAADGSGDDCSYPSFEGPDCSDCYTAWRIEGLDIGTAYLSQVDGTLSPAWTTANQDIWTIRDFTQPRDAKDEGTLSAVTSTSCVVHSDHPTVHWPLNYWNGPAVGGWIYLDNPAGTGIDIFELRQVTSCTALSAGGSASITWDSSQPVATTGYSRYRLVGLNTSLGLVGREYHVRQPAGLGTSGVAGADMDLGGSGVDFDLEGMGGSGGGGGAPTGPTLDLETFVGSHMYPRNPRGMPLANNSRVFTAYYPYAFVRWSRTGDWPWFEVPVNVQINPKTGRIILAEPAVVKSAGLAGTSSILSDHYPHSFAEGLYKDVQVVIPVNRGDLAVRQPATGFSGTAFTKYGIQRVKVQHLDTFTWQGDAASLALMASEHLAVSCNAVVSGSVEWYELPSAWDCMTPGYALACTLAGATTPLDGLDLPVRSATVAWHDDGPMLYSASMRFSTLRRPFQGDSLYIHPALSGQTFGPGYGGVDGSVFGSEMGQMAQDQARSMTPGRLASAIPVGQDVGRSQLAAATADNPLARSAGNNPLAAAVASNPLADANASNPLEAASRGSDPAAGIDMDPSHLGPSSSSGRNTPMNAAEKAASGRRAARETAEANFARVTHAQSPEARTGRRKEAREDAEAKFASQSHAAGLDRRGGDGDADAPPPPTPASPPSRRVPGGLAERRDEPLDDMAGGG